MAGNYPDAPSWRMAHDRDGTQWLSIDVQNIVQQFTAGQIAALNDEHETDPVTLAAGQLLRVVAIFPELRDVDGWFIGIDPLGAMAASVETSKDTTNGLDGTWTTLATDARPHSGAPKPGYRSAIRGATALAVRAIRFTLTAGGSQGGRYRVHTLHIYGEPAPGENLDRLELWHPTLDEKAGPTLFDWGNVPRGSSDDRPFRVKNLSATKTARQTRVAMEVATDAAPSVPGWHLLSYNGGTFLAQVNIGDLAPGAISAPVVLRRVTPTNAALSLWTFRVFAESTDWA